jgi:hypothetical protein
VCRPPLASAPNRDTKQRAAQKRGAPNAAMRPAPFRLFGGNLRYADGPVDVGQRSDPFLAANVESMQLVDTGEAAGRSGRWQAGGRAGVLQLPAPQQRHRPGERAAQGIWHGSYAQAAWQAACRVGRAALCRPPPHWHTPFACKWLLRA